jgi:hypothetical protein
MGNSCITDTSSIVRDYCEVIHLAGTEVVRSEVVVCLDEDRVPDVRVNISDIQREWSSP